MQTILNKLNGIDERLKALEVGGGKQEVKAAPKIILPEKKDELLDKAWDIISHSKEEEFSSDFLVKTLGVDEKRAEKIFDQLEKEGYGSCEWKEVN